MHHYFGGGYRVGLWFFGFWVFFNSLCSLTKETLQPWNSLQHTTFLQYYSKKILKIIICSYGMRKNEDINQYFSCCSLKDFTTRFIPLYLRYEAVLFFIIQSFEKQQKDLGN